MRQIIPRKLIQPLRQVTLTSANSINGPGNTAVKEKRAYGFNENKVILEPINNMRKRNNTLDITQIMQAQSLSGQQKQQITCQMKALIHKRLQQSERNIHTDLIKTIEEECRKLSLEVENERLAKIHYQKQIADLKSKISTLSEKLERVTEKNTELLRQIECQKCSSGEVLLKIDKLEKILIDKENELNQERAKTTKQIEKVRKQQIQLQKKNDSMKMQAAELSNRFEGVSIELNGCRSQLESLKRLHQQREMEFLGRINKVQIESEAALKKRNEKISKLEFHILSLQQKEKQEQSFKKQVTEKNKKIQKALQKEVLDCKSHQETISNLRKRVNDLSLLKSSNNTILNKKIEDLTEENRKLSSQLKKLTLQMKREYLQENYKVYNHEKPILFGSEDLP